MHQLDRIIRTALDEDIHTGDITTQSLQLPLRRISGFLKAKEEMVVCGLQVAERVFRTLDSELAFSSEFSDGARVASGTVLAGFTGDASLLLQGERVALNLM